MLDADARCFWRGNDQVVGQRAVQGLSFVIEREFRKQCAADTVNHTPYDLSVGDHRVQQASRVMHDVVIRDAVNAGTWVQDNLCDMNR